MEGPPAEMWPRKARRLKAQSCATFTVPNIVTSHEEEAWRDAASTQSVKVMFFEAPLVTQPAPLTFPPMIVRFWKVRKLFAFRFSVAAVAGVVVSFVV